MIMSHSAEFAPGTFYTQRLPTVDGYRKNNQSFETEYATHICIE